MNKKVEMLASLNPLNQVYVFNREKHLDIVAKFHRWS